MQKQLKDGTLFLACAPLRLCFAPTWDKHISASDFCSKQAPPLPEEDARPRKRCRSDIVQKAGAFFERFFLACPRCDAWRAINDNLNPRRGVGWANIACLSDLCSTASKAHLWKCTCHNQLWRTCSMHSMWPDYFDTLAKLDTHANTYGSAPPPLRCIAPPRRSSTTHRTTHRIKVKEKRCNAKKKRDGSSSTGPIAVRYLHKSPKLAARFAHLLSKGGDG